LLYSFRRQVFSVHTVTRKLSVSLCVFVRRFRAVCMKTVLQYVTYSTDDPTAAFLWVRLGCKWQLLQVLHAESDRDGDMGQRPAAPERLRPIDPTPVPD
jgi:hypothetical protein